MCVQFSQQNPIFIDNCACVSARLDHLFVPNSIINPVAVSEVSCPCQNQKCDCAPSEDSDQPGHPPSLIRVFAVCMKKPWVLSYPLSAQRRLIRLGGCPGCSESSLGAHSLCWVCHLLCSLGGHPLGKSSPFDLSFVLTALVFVCRFPFEVYWVGCEI